MEDVGGTASLRKAAAHWSLAGDKQLLNILQNLHEKIVTKCQETNSGLDEMVKSLDNASISLQNVNNRFMALSNTQFIESRVYEDEVEVASSNQIKEPSKPTDPTLELRQLRDSLRVLEAYHEPVHILDSDSESGSDEEEDRMVFKPKDLYSHRPLPYIIGSQQWRSKWHAGLVAEDSDTDSEGSKAHPPSEQYSDSEPEPGADGPTDNPHASQRTISTTSSIGSEPTVPAVRKPADVAAELARRLGGDIPHVPRPEPEPPVAAAPPKVYRPQQPTTATIFSDEPPPLDYQSDGSEPPGPPGASDSEDDVFAELHRARDRRAGPVDRLFGNVASVYTHKSNPSARQPSPLFQESQDSELFGDKPKDPEQPTYTNTQPDVSVKKPIGGISLFGNNQGTESIGAAILKRNQRRDSTSDEEVQEPQHVKKMNDETKENKAHIQQNVKHDIQKELINDLFTKSSKTKQTNKKVEKPTTVNIDKPVNKKVDLFNDDLFDDIDDIFTNVKPLAKETKQTGKKSLFDEDDDDLFANVATTSNKNVPKPESKSKTIFDSDDEFFKDEIPDNSLAKLGNVSESNTVQQHINNDELFKEEFSDINEVAAKTVREVYNDQHSTAAPKSSTTSLNNEPKQSLSNVTNAETTDKVIKSVQDKSLLKATHVKSIFDSDSDDDIFSDLKFVNDNSISEKSEHTLIHDTKNTEQLHNKTDENAVRKITLSPMPRNEINVNDENDKLSEQFKQSKKPVDAAEISPSYENSSTNNNRSLDKFEDNNKKTDEILTENLSIRSEVGTVDAEDEFLSSTNSNEGSSSLKNTNVSNTQVQSPSLLDEDDDLDEIFGKRFDNNKSETSDNRLDNKTSKLNESSKFTNNADNVSEINLLATEESNEDNSKLINKSDIHIASIAVDNETQTLQTAKAKNKSYDHKPHVKNDSEDLSNTNNVSNTLNDFEVTLACNEDTDSISIPNEQKENKTDFDNIQREPLSDENKESVLDEPDIFSDIFSDVPPEFERPKEPKKSKNVNALFDDDSDDETLFFKKNEMVSDDNPGVSFSSPDDRLFHIFHDEPPAIDVDFTQKFKKSLETSHYEKNPSKLDLYDQTKVKSLFKEVTQKEKVSDTLDDSESEKITGEARKPIGKLKPMNFNINVNSLLPGASPKKMKTEEQVDGQVLSSNSSENITKEESGMVKSVSFEGDPESEVLDNKLSKDRAKIQVKRRPSTRRARKEAVRKSGIDFGDDSTDTSTSTDISKKDMNINKIDVIKTTDNTTEKSINMPTKGGVDKAMIRDTSLGNSNNIDNDELAYSVNIIKDKRVNLEVEQNSQLFSNTDTNTTNNIKTIDSSTSDRAKQEEKVSESNTLKTAYNKRPNVKSKVVYILNDEDIFTDTKRANNLSDNINKVSENIQNNDKNLFTNPKLPDRINKTSETTQNDVKNKVLTIVDDDEELFKSGPSKIANISTLGNVYNDVNLKNSQIDDFDSNEDIFKASQSKPVINTQHNTKGNNNKYEIDQMEAKIDKLFVKTQGTKGKSSLFDDLSDDESELFGNKKNIKNPGVSDRDDVSTMKKEIKLPKNDAKRSLFGDGSDDDDLFGIRSTKKVQSQLSSKPKEVASKPAEPVFEDPLSMLTQEDDI